MLEFIFDGGFLMYPLLFMSILGFAVIIDRFCAFRAAKRDTKILRANVLKALEEYRLDDAMAECEKTGGPVAAVMLVGLMKFQKLEFSGRSLNDISDIVSKSMDSYAPQALSVLDRNLSTLPIVASLSPILGMTGTVTGMISSFNAMAESTTLEATTVSAGISEALITTAAGLLIAMPAVIAYNLFSANVDAYTSEIDTASTEIVDFIALDYIPLDDAAGE